MTTYNTGNPIGSNDPRDLYDNAENLDTAVNDTNLDTWIDRFGRSRKTMSGMERQFDAAEDYREATFDLTQSDRDVQFNADQDDRTARFNTFITSSGYQFLGDYADGIEITEYNQIVRDADGEFWRLSGEAELPYTTTGAGLPEGDSLMPLGDSVLRQELANPAMGAAMIGRGVVAVDSIADLLTLPEEYRKEDLRYLVKGYYTGRDVGGGEFYWDTAKYKSEADGGTIIDPANTSVFDGTPTSLSPFLNAQGDGTGTGCWVRLLDGSVSPEMFGAVGDGEVNDYRSLQAAADNSKGLPVKPKIKTTYKLYGSSPLSFNSGADFTGSVLDVEGYSSYINLGTGGSWSAYDSQSMPVTALRNGPDLQSPLWGSWDGIAEVDESFVILSTDEPYYTARGNVTHRREYNVVTRHGHVLSELKTPLKASDIQKAEVLKINKRVTEYRGFILRVGSNSSNNEFIRVQDATRIKVFDTTFEMDPSFVFSETNPTLFYVSKSCHVLVDGMHFSYPTRSTATSGYTYNLSLSDCYDIRVCNAIAQGDGWGSSGSNNCQRVVFENCDLSRIDFHHPVREFLKIRDCRIGSWGVIVTTIGDLIIENTTFKITDNTYVPSEGIIRSRNDIGGFCQGDLRITGCKFYNFSHITDLDIVQCRITNSNPKPVGTSLDYNFWENIIIRDTDLFAPSENYSYSLGMKGFSSDFIKSYKSVFVENCRGNSFINYFDESKALPPAPISNNDVESPNQTLYFSNSNLGLLSVTGKGSEHFLDITVENTRSPSKLGSVIIEGLVVELLCRGNLKINNSTVSGIRFFSGGTSTNERNVFINNSVLMREKSGYGNTIFDYLNAGVAYIDVLISNSRLLVDPSKAFSQDGLLYAAMSNCTVNGSNMLQWTTNSSINTPGLLADNTFTVVTGTSSGDNLRYTDVKLPARGSSKTYMLYVEDGSVHTVNLNMSDTGQLSIQAPEYKRIFLNTLG